MRSSPHFFVTVAAIMLPALCSGVDVPRYRAAWRDEYREHVMPTEWLQQELPPTERDLARYNRYRKQELSIRAVLLTFGMPDRYLLPTGRPDPSGSRWLVYDLADGYSVGFYIPHSDDFAMIVIVDSTDKPLAIFK